MSIFQSIIQKNKIDTVMPNNEISNKKTGISS